MTPALLQTFNAISDWFDLRGYAPSVREVAAIRGIEPPTAHEQIQHLVVRGLLDWRPGRRRSIRILSRPKVRPTLLRCIGEIR